VHLLADLGGDVNHRQRPGPARPRHSPLRPPDGTHFQTNRWLYTPPGASARGDGARAEPRGAGRVRRAGRGRRTTAGRAPVHWAVEVNNVAAVKALAARGADLDAAARDRATPLTVAARAGRRALVEALVEAGADVHARGENLRSALYFAEQNSFEAVADYLRKHGIVDRAPIPQASLLPRRLPHPEERCVRRTACENPRESRRGRRGAGPGGDRGGARGRGCGLRTRSRSRRPPPPRSKTTRQPPTTRSLATVHLACPSPPPPAHEPRAPGSAAHRARHVARARRECEPLPLREPARCGTGDFRIHFAFIFALQSAHSPPGAQDPRARARHRPPPTALLRRSLATVLLRCKPGNGSKGPFPPELTELCAAHAPRVTRPTPRPPQARSPQSPAPHRTRAGRRRATPQPQGARAPPLVLSGHAASLTPY